MCVQADNWVLAYMFTRSVQREIPAKLCALIFMLLAATPSALAQTYRGSLLGTVQDGSGAVVPSALVILRGAEVSFAREATSDSRGEFRMDELPPGAYHLIVQSAGFAEATSDVRVAVSSVREVTIALKPQSMRQSISVSAQASSITTQQLDVSSAIHQGVVSSRDLQEIPLAARSFANIAYLAP